MIDCEYYVPAWEGSKTSGPQPDFCLKHKVVLCGKCVKSCKEQNKQSEIWNKGRYKQGNQTHVSRADELGYRLVGGPGRYV